MNDVLEWHFARTKGILQQAKRKVLHSQPHCHTYAKRVLLDVEQGAQCIYELLQSNQPCMIGRYGAVELDVLSSAMVESAAADKALMKCHKKGHIYKNAGFFPEDIAQLKQFTRVMKESGMDADYIGVWFNTMEDYVIDQCTPKTAKIGLLRSIEPWYASNTIWTQALAGKKVLVIHPFSSTIRSQFLHRESLFADQRILPQFELIAQKAVQTAANEKDSRFSTWFEALEFMYEEAMRQDFDVAVLGCGAYGFPLAAMLKRAKKKAVHMGGATQLLFGIKGKRWDTHPVISGLYRDTWVRPDDQERPKRADIVEDSCYW
ncbi:MAG: hypothetical protein QM689_10690 [Oscillospiraceae bacterium]